MRIPSSSCPMPPPGAVLRSSPEWPPSPSIPSSTSMPRAAPTPRIRPVCRTSPAGSWTKPAGAAAARPPSPAIIPIRRPAGGGLVPKAESGCTGCGLCATKCPAGAIDPADPRQTDPQKCISCMRCVSICPDSARKINSLKAGAVAPGHQKGLPGAQRVRTLHLTGTCYYHRSDWTGSFLCGGCRFWFWGG